MFSAEVEVFAVPITIDDISATTWPVGSAKPRLAARANATVKNLADAA
ncbi:hypothetical protein GB927_023340 [Shinella sp. CPCC 100929]|uniref:Uncharacterized protein n=1 Tax=Shinella lacus TaxID=2654216 RepID=A0ABT1RCS7_9HYPH|nr:hypothetical protein [Shinella lacus]